MARATFIQILTFAHATLSTLCACQTRSRCGTLCMLISLAQRSRHFALWIAPSRGKVLIVILLGKPLVIFARVGSLSLQRGARFRLAPTDPGIEISTKFFHDDLVRFSCKCLCEGLVKVLVRRFCRRGVWGLLPGKNMAF